MGQLVVTETLGNVLTITINRPEKRNAVDKATAEAIGVAVDALDKDDDLRVAILTGAGGTFCAGMDLQAFARGERPVTEERGFAGICTVPPCKPIIAAVEGHALGGGLELAMACDLIVAGSDVRFGLPEVRRGLVAAAGGLLRLPRKVASQIAMEMVLTGQPIDAQRAANLGLINRITEPGHALAAAIEIAEEIAANAPLAIQASKEIVTRSQDWELVKAFELQRSAVQAVMASEDAHEGAVAFAEKRKPVWRGL
ncbi:crotonase/enoyl-CoA hydratase family protein [Mycolicibacterium austroafricanum]|nr:crotonase/enoyl-CoA hydratase family protein [Mycolicibacterium austroafricanum]QZT58567.1 crotonase/enoyl-CoA hydratase family protein [Mycolicibacterium austroafricanum]